VWLPSGCKRRHYPAKLHWKRDAWGEEYVRAADSQAACEARKANFDGFCGVKDAVMLHVPDGQQAPIPETQDMVPTSDDIVSHDAQVESTAQEPASQTEAQAAAVQGLPEGAPPLPDRPGCYLWLPSGCKRKRFQALHHWKRDEWGESHMNSAASRAACEDRIGAFNGFCGVTDAVAMYVPEGAPPSTDAQAPAKATTEAVRDVAALDGSRPMRPMAPGPQ